jgi:hypothetical protein
VTSKTRTYYPGIKRSKLAAQEAFEASFQKPGIARNNVDKLYFQGNPVPVRNRSVRQRGSNVFATADSHSAGPTPSQGGKKSIGPVASTSNLLHGEYGVDLK